MNKQEFQKIEEETRCKELHNQIDDKFVEIWNDIVDFCNINNLEPYPVMEIIKNKMSSKFVSQVGEFGDIRTIE